MNGYGAEVYIFTPQNDKTEFAAVQNEPLPVTIRFCIDAENAAPGFFIGIKDILHPPRRP